MKTALQILHLEDDRNDAELVRAELAAGGFQCESLRVDNRADFMGVLQQASFDIILADYALPQFDGLSALAIAREKRPEIPFIFVSGTLGEEVAIETLKSGATDYVLKSRLSRLVPALHRALAEAKQRAELKRAEHAMLQSEHKYRLLFECLSDAAFLVEAANGRVLDANKEAERMLGIPRASIIGTCRDQWLPRQPQAPPLPPPASDTEQTALPAFESHIIRQDGSTVPVLIERTPLALHGRQLLLELMRNITERKRAESALRGSERRYRRLFESAREGILVIDASTGEIIDVNPFLTELLGHPREQLLGRRPWELALFKGFYDSRSAFDELQSKGSVRSKNLALEKSDGQRVEVEVTSHAYLVDREKVVQCNFLDISERQRAADKLRESERRFRDMLGNVELVSLMLDREARVTYCNDYLLRITGWEREDVLGCDWFDRFLPSELVPELRVVFSALIRNRPDAWHHENEILTKTGARRLIRWNNSVLRSDTGDVIGAASIGEDITERKLADESLRQLSGRLIQVQDMERRRIARELHDNTAQQLAALTMNLSVARTLCDDRAEKREQLLTDSVMLAEKCSQEIRTLSYLLHPPLLDESGLNGALRDYADGFAKRSGLRVQLDLPEVWDRLPEEKELALFRVAQESLGNVNRHSGSLTAIIRLEREAGEVRLEVLDAGRGLPPEQLQRANVGASILGVGIAGMRERMHQLGGRLELSSSPQGTMIRACLPVGETTTKDK